MNEIESPCADPSTSSWRPSRRAIALGCAITLLFGIIFSIVPPAAEARLQQQTESPGQVVYQARHTLKDSQGDSWQVIFYKRVIQDENRTTVNLRLAAFPGAVEFLHPANLVMTTSRGDLLNAPDRFAEDAPALNVGEYQLNAVINRLPSRGDLELTLPLRERSRVLKIPYPVLLEWQNVIERDGTLASDRTEPALLSLSQAIESVV